MPGIIQLQFIKEDLQKSTESGGQEMKRVTNQRNFGLGSLEVDNKWVDLILQDKGYIP